MATKGEQTRERILRRTAPLFNQRGFAGASLADIMKATGLQKGGLYNHFSSKEDLAVAAFEYAVGRVNERVREWVSGKTTAPDRLRALIDGFGQYYESPPIEGGCPLMNTAIENDDSNLRLRQRAREALAGFLGAIEGLLKGGMRRGELRKDIDVRETSLVILAMFEGGLMLTRLHGDPAHLRQTTAFLRKYVQELEV